MRRNDKEIKSKREIENMIRSSRVCRVGFADGNKPYVLPFNFGYNNGIIYLHCAVEGRKLDVIKRNRNVCFEVDDRHELKKGQDACGYGFRYRSVVAEGRAVVVRSRAEKISGLKIIMEHITGKKFNSFRKDALDKIVVIKIQVEWMTGKKSGY